MTTGNGPSLLRHAVATVAYRGRKAIAGAPAGFADLRVSEQSRTPGQILAHIGDLFDWALSLADGQQRWQNSPPLAWDLESARFFDSLKKFDDRLAGGAALGCSAEQLFQGPVADALCHVGQIAMLRRIGGAPVRAENYFGADILAGRVGPDQRPPSVEFD